MELRQLQSITGEVRCLVEVAVSEGHTNMALFLSEYEVGENCFSREGEALFGAYSDDRLVGIGGLNVDPYEPERSVGRLRRMYVDPSFRGQGVGARLVERIEAQARHCFPEIQLFTTSPRAAAFYERLGYVSQHRHKVSHAKKLRADSP